MQDPLSINIQTQGIETTLPLLPEGDYIVQVKESSIDPNKDENGLNWNLKLGLVSGCTAIDGRNINPDFPVFTVAALQAKADSKDPEAFKRTLGEWLDALFGCTKDNRPALTHELVASAVGKTVLATVYLDEWKGNKNNKVRRLKPLTAAA